MSDGSPKRKSEKPASRAGLHSGHAFFLAALLVAPVLALVRLDGFGQPIWIAAGLAGVSVVAFLIQWLDKRQAEVGGWRVPEKFLHLLEFSGGWPGAFLAQRLFRHKTSKVSYQFIFWLIVIAYEYAAIDFLLGWKILRYVRTLIGF